MLSITLQLKVISHCDDGIARAIEFSFQVLSQHIPRMVGVWLGVGCQMFTIYQLTGEVVQAPMSMTYSEWMEKQRELYGADSVETARKKLMNRGADKKQWEAYIEIAGKKDMPKTLDDFQQLKYNKVVGYDWRLTKGYVDGIRQKELSALTGITTYQATAQSIDNQLIGMTTSDGVNITGYKTHFLNRVIGDYQIPREGVDVQKVLDVLQNSDSKATPHNSTARWWLLFRHSHHAKTSIYLQ